ncbi:hypothetical protein Aple_089300 [Acrocarpospora pleiomorpha]|uniref:Uncharacterized protein n=1 Tax=Acrocarpospora pleiomorpha TaxID=90975 RepID=A0A5M3Y2Q1_9ACTN|nr:hypothetical protein [Acrocarpospora pleiomorpha]GES26031.1 hypothetical protein Aple_089300 [Acrocarpospora pleiomorpha]
MAFAGTGQGFLVGEVVRRLTERSMGAFFAEEVAGPAPACHACGTCKRRRVLSHQAAGRFADIRRRAGLAGSGPRGPAARPFVCGPETA